jgi:hypothetical protein
MAASLYNMALRREVRGIAIYGFSGALRPNCSRCDLNRVYHCCPGRDAASDLVTINVRAFMGTEGVLAYSLCGLSLRNGGGGKVVK